MAKVYVIGGRSFTKVLDALADRDPAPVHVVEGGNFWKGHGGYQHIAVCGLSVSGTPVTHSRVNCHQCRAYIRALQTAHENAPRAGATTTTKGEK